MLFFDLLTATYHMESKYMIDGEEESVSLFNSRVQITASFKKNASSFHFTINRSDIQLNGYPPRKSMDKAICRIGDSLYPLVLKVTPQLYIQSILNFEEIKRRWSETTEKVLKENPSRDLVKYIQRAKNNFLSELSLKKALSRDTFINLYFRDIFTLTKDNEARSITWFNFPKKNMNQSYFYQIKKIKEDNVRALGEIMKIIPDHIGNYEMDYHIGSKGEIFSITGRIETIWQEKRYKKQITIKSEDISVKCSDIYVVQ